MKLSRKTLNFFILRNNFTKENGKLSTFTHFGFTLMELIVVIAIISILSGLLMPALQKARGRAMKAKAQSTINSLQMALSIYETDYGVYPQSARTSNGAQRNGNSKVGGLPYTLVEALIGTSGSGPYMEFKEGELDESNPNRPVLLDPWGQAYVYVSRYYFDGSGVLDSINVTNRGPFHPFDTPITIANLDNNTYNIYSLGADKKTYQGQGHDADWNRAQLFNSRYDGDTAYGLAGNNNRKWLLDDVNSWE